MLVVNINRKILEYSPLIMGLPEFRFSIICMTKSIASYFTIAAISATLIS